MTEALVAHARGGLLAGLMLLMHCLFPTAAQAQLSLACTATIDNLNFGAVAGTAINTSFNLHYSCDGFILGVGAGLVKICPYIQGGSAGVSASPVARRLSNGAAFVNYELYTDVTRLTVWGPANGGTVPRSSVLVVSPIIYSGSIPIYARYLSGQGSAAAGTYTSSMAGFVTVTFTTDDLLPCPATPAAGGVTPSFTVRADRLVSCSVTTNMVDFGTVAALGQVIDAQGALGVNCTPNTPFSVSLGNGANGTSATTRRMAMGAQRIDYGLYSNTGRTQVWGSTIGVDTIGGTGVGSMQNFPVYGRVPVQTTPPTGTYTDTVTVTVTY